MTSNHQVTLRSLKVIDQSVFVGRPDSIVCAYVNAKGEGRLTAAPFDDCEIDGDSWSTPLEYGSGYSLGYGYDPKSWQKSLLRRTDSKAKNSRKAALSNKIYDRAINIFNVYEYTPVQK